MFNSTQNTPLPTGPRQVAVSLTAGFQFTPRGVVTSVGGVFQPYIANADGTGPVPLGSPVNLPPPTDPAMQAFMAGVAPLMQALINAKGV